jgi:hypothetical protein
MSNIKAIFFARFHPEKGAMDAMSTARH